jgi:CHRD domain-containing protein
MRSRNNRRIGLVVVSVVALIAAGAAIAGNTTSARVSARMTARQVIPQKPKGDVAHASATLAGTLTGNGSHWKLSWRLGYRLSDPSIVVADVHYGKSGHFGPVILRLCGPCKSGQRGVKRVPYTWVPAIQRGNTFVTLVTGKNPNGEVRGQIRVG